MNGYNSVENCTSVDSFLELARSLGEIICHPNGELYDIVIANDGTNARTGSFSKNFSFKDFPLHTDTAFWAIPARLLVMWSPKASSASTTIVSWNDLLKLFSESEKNILYDAIFTVHTYEHIKYSGVKFVTSGKKGFRYDPNIMHPANKQGEEFVMVYKKAIQEVKLVDFNWSGSNALVLDNWNMLHGRKHVENIHENRRVFRAYVR
ncbi:TauD/TfdA family dioxygenase [Yersinia enterocolitica]|uniref:TauD/TfdA family dioxygenase n=1 Tax=Yersinia alsatica TaxID=2890317 RepID=A0ABY5UJC3_9GAMM|nr:TauD/TfdA family dioxygenase [Yersinia alsatica]OWF69052.1 hypothetical protein B4901_08435 [Yersinia frederiksenii]UWM43588.1 TauD/TfdA family dioxygenase [Yersinia alsatica]CNK68919.1 Taurine catabolism dioxygenase TauD%2C TfdA family [Yersinia frederiksenii]CNL53190.1 Taurine catabolism dioxygenase TauD%2C TfdA family [Yersinia frederiksenii]